LLTGCAVGGEVPGTASPEPRADLAEKAEVAAENLAEEAPARASGRRAQRRSESAGDKGAASGAAASRAGGSSAATTDLASTSTTGSTGDTSSWRELVSLEDPVADHGEGPRYADLARLDFRERGDRLSLTVTLAGVVPAALADREVQGVGIDLFRSSSDESDYQVFLDGGRHGWRAFLQTPGGFVDFPGTFAVDGRTLSIVVPWSAVGGRDGADVSAFVDWSSGVDRLSTDGTLRVDLPVE
jgi:hypothetical protein